MSEKRNIPFSPPDISEREIELVAQALRSGWITTGPKTKELERQVAHRVGTERCVCLNSQTACAETALRILGIGPDDEVITCAYTYTATASVVCHVGAKLVLVDCQRGNVEIDYDVVEQAITERTKVIIPIDLGGIPCDYDRLYEIVERKRHLFRPKSDLQEKIGRVVIMSDAAHAFGAMQGNTAVGALADFTNFSFHAVKNLTTAEGGAMTWRSFPGVNDEDIYKRAQLLSLHGQSKDALAKTQLGAWEYDIVGPWYKCNMTDVAAAMGLAQLERYDTMLRRRRAIISRYDALLRPLGVETLPHYTDSHTSSGHLYLTFVPGITPQERNDIIVKMAERGIACNVHYKPLPLHTAYQHLGFRPENFPNAVAAFEREITLPLHTRLSDEDVAYVVENYVEILKEYTK